MRLILISYEKTFFQNSPLILWHNSLLLIIIMLGIIFRMRFAKNLFFEVLISNY